MPITLPKITDPIEYLIHRKYPSPMYLRYGKGKFVQVSEGSAWQQNVDAYRAELEAKTPEGITALYLAEVEKEGQEVEAEAERQEKMLFFNHINANADFEFWSKAKHWTVDEAVALSLGKAPGIINWKVIQPLVFKSPFAARYAQVRELALRAIPWNEMFDPVLPGIFIAWARRLEIDFPKELEEKVIARGGNIADWKSAYDTLEKTWQAKYSDLEDDHKKTMRILYEKNAQILTLMQENASLKANLAELEKQKKNATEKPLKTTERNTLLKMVFSMAKAWHGYDPGKARSNSIAEIRDDLERHGASMDDETIRKYLRLGAEFFPETAGES